VGFDLIQGVLDLLFVVVGAISIVYLRVVRARMRHLAIEKGRRPPLKDPVENPVRSASPSPDSGRNEIAARQELELSRMKTLLTQVSMERSRLQVAFYDAERMIEDLESIQLQPPPPAPFVPPPPAEPVSPVPGKNSPLTDQEKAVSWSMAGLPIPEIAKRLGRSEGEVELILGMARLSGGGAG
jgi:hypothetical protein